MNISFHSRKIFVAAFIVASATSFASLSSAQSQPMMGMGSGAACQGAQQAAANGNPGMSADQIAMQQQFLSTCGTPAPAPTPTPTPTPPPPVISTPPPVTQITPPTQPPAPQTSADDQKKIKELEDKLKAAEESQKKAAAPETLPAQPEKSNKDVKSSPVNAALTPIEKLDAQFDALDTSDKKNFQKNAKKVFQLVESICKKGDMKDACSVKEWKKDFTKTLKKNPASTKALLEEILTNLR